MFIYEFPGTQSEVLPVVISIIQMETESLCFWFRRLSDTLWASWVKISCHQNSVNAAGNLKKIQPRLLECSGAVRSWTQTSHTALVLWILHPSCREGKGIAANLEGDSSRPEGSSRVRLTLTCTVLCIQVQSCYPQLASEYLRWNLSLMNFWSCRYLGRIVFMGFKC